MSRTSLFIEILQVTTIKGPSQTFLWGYTRLQRFQDFFFGGDTSNQNTGLWSTTKDSNKLLTNLFIKVFWNSCTKNFGKSPENRVNLGSLLTKITRLQCTVYCRAKNSTAETFLEMLRKEIMFLSIGHSRKTFATLSLFLWRYWTAVQNIWSNKNWLPEKCFLSVFWNS